MSRFKLTPEAQLEEIKVGVAEIISEVELLAKLRQAYSKDKPLVIKFGADPSRPDIHLGHTVVLNKLKLFQDLGHEVVFIIGDFTGLIGDPTGKSKTRTQLTEAEVKANAETYKTQVFKILDPDKTRVVFNSTWLNKLTPIECVRLLASHTVQQVLAREDFAKRYRNETPIFLHELAYPIFQGYDSVHLRADVELGGTDQTFNFLFARELQRHFSLPAQCIVTVPLLEGLDGVQKMSKSYDNYIALTDSPKDMFGKTMSITDTHMLRFYELLSRRGKAAITAVKNHLAAGTLHPMEAKKDIAEEIVAQYWGVDVAREARSAFEQLFSAKQVPTDLPVHRLSAGEVNILDLAVTLGFAQSKGEARRILKQNGMKLDDDTITAEKISLNGNSEYVFKQGKLKMVRLVVE